MRHFLHNQLLLARMILLAVVCALSQMVQAEESGRRFAFFVGVAKYDHSAFDSLPYTERDVEESAKWLEQVGYDVFVLSEERGRHNPRMRPTAANLRDRLMEFLKSRKAKRDDLILVGLAGHGIQPRGSAENYFCPSDANPSMRLEQEGRVQVPKQPETLVAVADLLTILKESGIGTKLILIDACRVEPHSKGHKGIAEITTASLPPQTAVLLSCSRGQFSFEDEAFGGGHGVFFHCVLEGLKGGAEDQKRRRVTWHGLTSYVIDSVPERIAAVAHLQRDGAIQNPQIIANLDREQPVLIPKSFLDRMHATTDRVKSPAKQPTSEPKRSTRAVDLIGARAGQERVDNGLKMNLVWCPSGKFVMGSPRSETHRGYTEDQVNVTLTQGFWIGKYEVTQKEWTQVLDTTPWKDRQFVTEGDRIPATYVSWTMAHEFSSQFTQLERTAGRITDDWEYRLPTEAEWEYACRAGTRGAYSFGDDLRNSADSMWCQIDNNSSSKAKVRQFAQVVGGRLPNPWRLHDMHGNVHEWCEDSFEERLLGGVDPEVRGVGGRKVYRGGGWNSDPSRCRSAHRDRYTEDYERFDLGFRIALCKIRGSPRLE